MEIQMKKILLSIWMLLAVGMVGAQNVPRGEEGAGVYVPLQSSGGILKIYNQSWLATGNVTYLASAARTATQTQADQINTLNHGIYVYCNVSIVPGIDTVAVSVQSKDSLSGVYSTIATTTASALTGLITVKISPYLAPVAASMTGVAVNEYLPATWRIVVTHSAGTSFTYSCSYNLTAN